jgi:hypothetical protein
MQIKHFLLLFLLCGLPSNLQIKKVDLKEGVTFLSDANSITAQTSDIIGITLTKSLRLPGDTLFIEFTKEFGRKLFFFTLENMGKEVIVYVAGIKLTGKVTIKYVYTERIGISGLTNEESDFLKKHLELK